MRSREGIKEVAKALRKYKSYLILSHQNLDGDSIGSMLALSMALRRLEKKVVIASSNNLSQNFNFLPGSDKIVKKVPKDCNFDSIILIECSGEDTVDQVYNKFRNKGIPLINIDHHRSNNGFGDYVYIDKNASAVGEQIYFLTKKLNVKINKNIATCLYLSIMNDTGNFRFSSTTDTTFKIAHDLVKRGAEPSLIYRKVYEEKSLSAIKLIASSLNTLHFHKEGEIAYSYVTQKMLKDAKTTEINTDDIIDLIRSIKDVKIALLFKEMGKNRIKVSIRSKGDIDVSKIAEKFSGGGHRGAAGFSIKGDVEEAVKKSLREVSKNL